LVVDRTKASFGSRVKRRGLVALAVSLRQVSEAGRRVGDILVARRAGSAGGGVSDPEVREVNPANIAWIFCVARSRSTWLSGMMGELQGHEVWKEPRVGHLPGEFYANTPKAKTESANFIMGGPMCEAWISSIRNFVLVGARHAFPRLGPEDYLVIKEPGVGVGAPFLMQALPESRIIRDPRGVVASSLDATRKDSW
jgi:hypothetical protein